MWFQGSAAPPSWCGMQPSRSWTAAMAAAVSAASKSCTGGDHGGLTEEGVERAFDQAGQAGLAHRLPDREAVVQSRQRVAVVGGPDGALEPPVRRWPAMGRGPGAPREAARS